MKPHDATVVREHTVQHERVQMNVQVQRSTEALNNHYGAAATIVDAVTTRAAPEEPEYRADGRAADRAAQVVIPRQQVPQPMRQAENPLADWHVRKHMIDQMCRPLGHPPAAAPWAEPAALAREGDQSIQPAGGAPKAGEAGGETTAPQEVTKLLLDKLRKPVAIPQRRGLGAEVSKWSRTIPNRTVVVGSPGS
jgi:hypothetical protein